MGKVNINSRRIYENGLIDLKNIKSVNILNYTDSDVTIVYKDVPKVLTAMDLKSKMPTTEFSIPANGEDYFDLQIEVIFQTGKGLIVVDYREVELVTPQC